MLDFEYVVSLEKAHNDSGKSRYRVNKDTGIAAVTILRYTKGILRSKKIGQQFLQLCDYYGVKFHDVVKVQSINE